MEKELENLITLTGTPKFDTELEKMYKKYKGNPDTIKYLSGLIQKGLSGIKNDLLIVKEELVLKKSLKIYPKCDEELKQLQFALKDISKKIGVTSVL